LKEGEPVTLMGRSDVFEDGFPWFKLTTQSGQTGYQWGGILCSTAAERPDLFKTCLVGSPSQSGAKKPSKSGSKKKEPRCKNHGVWDGLRCRPGIGLIVVGMVLFALWGQQPYSAPVARLTCGLWALALASLTYWAWTFFEEGTLKTVATILGGGLTFGGIMQVFKARPLAPKGDDRV
jgi:hypothetical protein